ncbi:MAG: DedA family protein [Verrucomicrobiaceae bacterium]|nr:MAG: DedA family protein [Verrucomicrobiaceae bacterium]
MANWISSWIDQMSYFGVALLMILENVFPPIPSEVILPLCGYLAGQGKMTFWGVILAATIGSVLGQLPLYYLGRYLGTGCLKNWLQKHPLAAISPGELDKAMKWFERYGSKAVLFCRLVPGLRSLISLPAGICGMKLPKFLLYTVSGTLVWSLLLAWAGWSLGEKRTLVETYLHPISNGVFIILAVLYIWRVVRRYRTLHKERNAGA